MPGWFRESVGFLACFLTAKWPASVIMGINVVQAVLARLPHLWTDRPFMMASCSGAK